MTSDEFFDQADLEALQAELERESLNGGRDEIIRDAVQAFITTLQADAFQDFNDLPEIAQHELMTCLFNNLAEHEPRLFGEEPLAEQVSLNVRVQNILAEVREWSDEAAPDDEHHSQGGL